MLRTRLTERLRIEHPVVLGGMGGGTNVALVAAVSEAGGLGILGASGLSPEQIRERAAEIRGLTARPFGLNLLISFTTEAQLEACLDSGASVLSTAWGDPAAYGTRAREAGVPWMHMVQTAAQAAEAARLGATAIVAQGHEGGGHIGLVSTMPLIPAAAGAIARTLPGVSEAERPVLIAAGGIADGRGLAAALTLGADGVLLGTRFLATQESPISAAAKEAILRASEADTIASVVPDQVSRPEWTEIGALARAIRTEAVMEWIGREDELRAMTAEQRREIAQRWAAAAAEGKVEGMSILAGEDSGLISELLPAAEVVRRTVAEAEEVLGRLGRLAISQT